MLSSINVIQRQPEPQGCFAAAHIKSHIGHKKLEVVIICACICGRKIFNRRYGKRLTPGITRRAGPLHEHDNYRVRVRVHAGR